MQIHDPNGGNGGMMRVIEPSPETLRAISELAEAAAVALSKDEIGAAKILVATIQKLTTPQIYYLTSKEENE